MCMIKKNNLNIFFLEIIEINNKYFLRIIISIKLLSPKATQIMKILYLDIYNSELINMTSPRKISDHKFRGNQINPRKTITNSYSSYLLNLIK